MKQKKKVNEGIRNATRNMVKEKDLEENIKYEIAKEINSKKLNHK